MAKKIIFESKLIPGAVFDNYDDALKAEQEIERKKNEGAAFEAISKFGRVAPSMQMARDAGEDAWMTAPKDQLKSIAEGQVLNEQFGNDLGLARGLGLPANTSEPAKQFVEGLQKEKLLQTQETRANRPTGTGYSAAAERSKDFELLKNLPDGAERDKAMQNYLYKWAPSTGYNADPNSLDMASRRAYQTGYGSESGRTAAETNAAGGVNPVISEKTTGLRKEFIDNPDIQRASKLFEQFSKANDVWEEYKAGKIDKYEADQSLAFFASKALDDGVVMPGEFQRFQEGLSTPEQFAAFFKRMRSGGLQLDDTQRQAMINIVNRGYKTAFTKAKAQRDNYVRMAQKNGVDPDDVVSGYDYIFGSVKSSAPSQPKPPVNPSAGLSLPPASKPDETKIVKYVRDPITGKLVRQ